MFASFFSSLLGFFFNRYSLLLAVIVVIALMVVAGKLVWNRFTIGGLVLLALGIGLWTLHDSWVKTDREATAAPYIAKLAEIQRLGEEAQAAATEKTRIDIASKRMADDENKITIAKLTASVVLLRKPRAETTSRYFVPQKPTTAGSSDRACYNGAELESAIRRLDQGVQGLVDQGSHAVIDLNTAKTWAQALRELKAIVAKANSGGAVLNLSTWSE